MAKHNVDSTLTIASAATDSETFNNKTVLGTMVDMIVYCPATLTGTITLQASYKEAPTTEWFTVYINGANLAFAASKAVQCPIAAVKAIRIHSSASEGQEDIFHIVFNLAGIGA